jgi:hypothetical protein
VGARGGRVTQPAIGSPRVGFTRWLALAGFAVLAPLLELLRHHPQFLIAHGAGAADVVAIVLAVGFALPIFLLGLERGVAAISPGLGAVCGLVLVGALVGLACLPPLVRAFPGAGAPVVFAVVTGIAIVAAAAFARSPAVRRFSAWLALGPPIFLLGFWLDPNIQKLGSDEHVALASAGPIDARAPIVWIVFDEFPITSLMASDQTIDAVQYPHFAELAATSTWFRDTTSVSDSTALAVPAILTARYPDPRRLPLRADHPANLFSLLAPAYSQQVVETRTLLHDRDPGAGDARVAGRLLSDLSILFAHMLAPADLAQRLPAIRDDWKGFAQPTPSQLAHIHEQDYSGRMRAWSRFVAGLEACREGSLHFVHVPFPHPPWNRTPTGRIYQPDDVFGIGGGRLGLWNGDPWWPLQAEQRHLFQVAFADRMLGEAVAALKRSGAYDAALIVVVADHALSFRPGASRRLLPGHPEPGDLLRVPFFLKAPGQTTAMVNDTPLETVDILPTALARIGVEVPWSTDGADALAPDFPRRDARTSFGRQGERFSIPNAKLAVGGDLARKIAAFGSGATRDRQAFGAYRALVGREVAALPKAPGQRARVTLAAEPFDAASSADGAPTVASAARVTGRLWLPAGEPGPVQIAIAERSRIVGVGPAVPSGEGEQWFSLFVPEPDRAELAVYLVRGPPHAPVLTRAHTDFAPILATATRALRSAASADGPR